MVIVLILVLVMFGAGKLPEVGKAMGKSIRNFKEASEGKDAIEINPGPGKEARQETDQRPGKEGAAKAQG